MLGYTIGIAAIASFVFGVYHLLSVVADFRLYIAENHPDFWQDGAAVSRHIDPIRKGSLAWLIFQSSEDFDDATIGKARRRIKRLFAANVASLFGLLIVLLVVREVLL